MFVAFDSKKHPKAFEEGRLYQSVLKEVNGEFRDSWEKVDSKIIYEDALSNPIFFAVKVEEETLSIEDPVVIRLEEST